MADDGAEIAASSENREWLWMGSLIFGLLAVFVMTDAASAPQSVEGLYAEIHVLWSNATARQVTGYTLLAFLLVGLGLSARRRWPAFRYGSPHNWRWIHAGAGLGALLLFGLHTGLDIGAGLTRWLLGSFLAVVGAGALTGMLLGTRVGPQLRRTASRLHLLAAWPLPVLLGWHVLSVYWF